MCVCVCGGGGGGGVGGGGGGGVNTSDLKKRVQSESELSWTDLFALNLHNKKENYTVA